MNAYDQMRQALDEQRRRELPAMNDPIAALIEADKHRTPGEWHPAGKVDAAYILTAVHRGDDCTVAYDVRMSDAAFIAAAANAMPAIVAMVEENAELSDIRERMREQERASSYFVEQNERLRAELAECRKAIAASIREEALREAAGVADDFLRADNWVADTCIGIRESILSLIEKKL